MVVKSSVMNGQFTRNIQTNCRVGNRPAKAGLTMDKICVRIGTAKQVNSGIKRPGSNNDKRVLLSPPMISEATPAFDKYTRSFYIVNITAILIKINNIAILGYTSYFSLCYSHKKERPTELFGLLL